jgi:hypothetical protein
VPERTLQTDGTERIDRTRLNRPIEDPGNTPDMINWHRQFSARPEPKDGAKVPGISPIFSTTHPKRLLVLFWNIKLL